MENPHHPKRLLVWCIGNEVLVAHDMESQRLRGQVRASMPDVWGGHGSEDVGDYAVGSVDVVFGDVFPDLVNVGERCGMEGLPLMRRSAAARSYRAVAGMRRAGVEHPHRQRRRRRRRFSGAFPMISRLMMRGIISPRPAARLSPDRLSVASAP